MMKAFIYFSLALLLVSCRGNNDIEDRGSYEVNTSQHAYAAFPRVHILVIHYTAGDFDTSLSTLVGNNVSAHYLIAQEQPKPGDKPLVWQLVPESDIAWHAGVSYWRGTTRLNDVSVGIELENAGWVREHGVKRFAPFPVMQINALIPLARDIIQRYHIKPQNVVAHADIAPQRKQDPGPLFPWEMLAHEGIGAWPDTARVTVYLAGRPAWQPVPMPEMLALLSRYGYEVTPGMSDAEQHRVVAAFQMHFRPAKYDGNPDAQTEAIARALLEKYPHH
ncbi:N-acetylmuramoyl-L-alanine amidase [Mangrovibacter phragmitis]|uniref:N-acetylmuramoyl-L-alanine amidase n=2 Tax=Mangrovibacter phragmitis TaxID=1691903 RepID=A0A1B7L066_9ENTR|nr:N-acetylmuramoyl-L-alanine amidase [Mangrovibacter phragmitis]OAT75737.1 N-acetylmuramoyl-L-alanine amidase [Mangrovibacter phragmitis]